MHRTKYQSKFGDIPLDFMYVKNVYHRVLNGYAYVNGHYVKVKAFPNGFWTRETAIELTRYVSFELNHWNKEQVLENLTTRFLRDNSLTGVCKQFGNSSYTIVRECFPEWDVEPWELASCPNAFWNDIENCASALRWVVNKEGLEDDDKLFCNRLSVDLLRKYHVGNAVKKVGSLFKLVDAAYPGKYKPWNLKKMAKVSDEVVCQAVRWMIDEQLHWNHDEVCENICVRTFYEHGIGGVLSKGCNHSPIVALQKAYPGEYERWMLKNAENPFKR